MIFVSKQRNDMDNLVKIEVAYATPEAQKIVVLEVKEGTSIREAAMLSGLEKLFPEIDYTTQPMGIFGKKIADPDQQVVASGDRIEIYRPLIIDPKQARLNRAAKVAKS